MALYYINQRYLTVRKGQHIIYGDHKTFGQTVPPANPPKDLKRYILKDYKMIINQPLYDPKTGSFVGLEKTGSFLGLEETIAFISIRGNAEETFSDYFPDENNKKILYSY